MKPSEGAVPRKGMGHKVAVAVVSSRDKNLRLQLNTAT